MSNADALPTSVRLTVQARKLLDEAIELTGQSRSQLVNQAVEAQIPRIVARARKTPEERMAWLDSIAGVGARLGVARSTEDIDASIREMRGDR